MAQQLTKVVEAATSPFQYALSTRAGYECVAHTLQALYEINPETTVVSVDGISAHDVVSRRAMLEGLHSVHRSRGIAVCSHVLQFSVPVSVGGLGGGCAHH